ncbi:hypothetical protein AB0912_34305 [Streptomyces sp. NPDC007084]|uniref:hypothetical protein n=1 Tax=Streptomyces sp. NPDC007084 TaxID=3154313 RepID=UPI0034543EFD
MVQSPFSPDLEDLPDTMLSVQQRHGRAHRLPPRLERRRQLYQDGLACGDWSTQDAPAFMVVPHMSDHSS